MNAKNSVLPLLKKIVSISFVILVALIIGVILLLGYHLYLNLWNLRLVLNYVLSIAIFIFVIMSLFIAYEMFKGFYEYYIHILRDSMEKEVGVENE